LAIVLPFPSCRRVTFVRRHAGIMATLSRDGGERHLERQLNIQSEAMDRRGVPPALVREDRATLETAIRFELFRLGFARGGVA
jgi:hypothetical protein